MGDERGTYDLEVWCKTVTKGYAGVNIENMTTSWRNGLAFCAIINYFRPELIDFAKLNKDDVYKNNELAFKVAEKFCDIPALLGPEEMVDYPDQLYVMVYLSQFYETFSLSSGSPQLNAMPRIQSVSNRDITSTSIEIAVRTGSLNINTLSKRMCTQCGSHVYIAETLYTRKKLYHRTCLRCAFCNNQLLQQNYETDAENKLFCKPCFKEKNYLLTNEDQSDYTCMFKTALDYSNFNFEDTGEVNSLESPKLNFNTNINSKSLKTTLEINNNHQQKTSSSPTNIITYNTLPLEHTTINNTEITDNFDNQNLQEDVVKVSSLHNKNSLSEIIILDSSDSLIIVSDDSFVDNNKKYKANGENNVIITINDESVVLESNSLNSPILKSDGETKLSDSYVTNVLIPNLLNNKFIQKRKKSNDINTSVEMKKLDDSVEINGSRLSIGIETESSIESFNFSEDEQSESEERPLKKIIPNPNDYVLKGNTGDTPEFLKKILIKRISTGKPHVDKPKPVSLLRRVQAPKISLSPFWDHPSRNESSLESSAPTTPDSQPKTPEISIDSLGSFTSISSEILSKRKAEVNTPRLLENRRRSLPLVSTPFMSKPTFSSIEDCSPIYRSLEELSVIQPSENHKLNSIYLSVIDQTDSVESEELENVNVVEDFANTNRQRETRYIKNPNKPHQSSQDKWKNRNGQAPKPIPQKRTIATAEHQRELNLIEVQYQTLEKQGVNLEQMIRERCQSPNVDRVEAICIEVEYLTLQLFEVIKQQNALRRRQAELTSEIMELEVEMRSLEICHKKRRLSGFIRIRPIDMDKSTTELYEKCPFESTSPEDMDSQNANLEETKCENSSAALRRSSRKRSATDFWVASMMKDEKIVAPAKSLSLEENPKEIEKLYLNRSIKRLTPSLETIFEVPEDKKVMSSRKFRRALNFGESHMQNRHKLKKRAMKAKKITKHITKEKITMSFLMQKLADIDADN